MQSLVTKMGLLAGCAVMIYLLLSRTQTVEFSIRDNTTQQLLHAESQGKARSQQVDEVDEVVFLMIVCDGKQKDISNKLQRQLEHTEVALKSAAALTFVQLRFIIICDNEELFKRIVGITSQWPEQYRSKVSFEFVPVWYSSERNNMRNNFRPCATELLFAPSILPQEEAVLFIDTDVIFMRSPEDLWKEFDNFNSEHMASMAPSALYYTDPKFKLPYYGQAGLNSGVMLMNLTRIRSFPHEGGYLQANLRRFDEIKSRMTAGDQDVFNAFYYDYPQYIRELGCEWNYIQHSCDGQRNACPLAGHRGAALVHGNGLSFLNGNQPKRMALYELWRRYRLDQPLTDLYRNITRDLELTERTNWGKTSCGRVPNIDLIFSKQLHTHIVEKLHLQI